MVKGLGDDIDKGKGIAFDLNLEPEPEPELDDFEDCSICVKPLGNKNNDRTVVKLCCQHEFHLDCIGSAFNAKYKMECPNCRNIEQGQWLYASGPLDQDIIAEEYDDEEQEQDEIDVGSFPDMLPSIMPRSSLHPTVFPYGPRQFGGNGIATNPWLPPYGPNQFLYDGFMNFDEFIRHDLTLENIILQNRLDPNVALLAAHARNLHPSTGSYGGGESSRSEDRRRDGGGGSGNGGGTSNCGRSG